MTTATAALAIPKHLGVIPDGNRRWARERGLPTLEGHRKGLDVSQEVCLEALDRGVEYMTMYAFSTENWNRSQEEVGYLMDLFLRFATHELRRLEDRGVRFRVIGSREGLSDKLLKALDNAEARTAANPAGTLSLALNYGGERELADAVRNIVASGVRPEDVTTELIQKYLYAPDIPPVDLIIRTSGEERTSGFMLARAAYSELYFVDKQWPDFSRDDLRTALAAYGERQRRFGA